MTDEEKLSVGRRLGTWALLAGLLLLPLVSTEFTVFQATTVLIYTTAVLGVNLTLGFNGLVSLAQGAFFAIGAYSVAILVTQYEFPFIAAILVGGVIAGGAGLLVGLPALRLPGLQLAILTFGLAVVVSPLLVKFSAITKGVSGITFNKPAPPPWFPGNADQWLYLIALCVFVLYAVMVRRLLQGDSGRSIRALRDAPLVAASLGVNATRIRLSVFAISSGFAGIAGGLFAISQAYVNPDSFQALKSIEFIIASVIGGATTVAGAVIGAAFIVFVPEWAGSANVSLGAIVYGVILMLVCLLAPQGVVGLLEKLWLIATPNKNLKMNQVEALGDVPPSKHPIVKAN